MQIPLYPQTAEQLAVSCPYCGGPDLQDAGREQEGARCVLTLACSNCGRAHHVGYTATMLTLESNDDSAELIEFVLPITRLQDQGIADPSQAKSVPVGVFPALDGLCVVAHGYGDFVSERGYGCPLILESYEGRLRVVAWHDINEDDGTTVVDLNQAQEDERDIAPENPFEARLCDRTGTVIEGRLFQTSDEAIEFAQANLPRIPGHQTIVVELGAFEEPLRWSSDVDDSATRQVPMESPSPTPAPCRRFAKLEWTAADIMGSYNVSVAEAEEFLTNHERELRDRLCELGNEILDDLAAQAGLQAIDDEE